MTNGRRRFLKYSLMAGGAPYISACSQRERVKVLIVGGGLAGLNCARILQSTGLDPVVLEASDQPGGRTLSQTVEGETINLGGIEIGDGYTRFMQLVEELKLSTFEPAQSASGLSIFHNEQLIDARNWSKLPSNPLSESNKAKIPSRLQYSFHAGDLPLKSTSDWLDEKYFRYDIAESDSLRSLGASEAAIDLINRAGNFNHVDTISTLHVLRAYANYQFGTSTKTLRLKGGNQQLCLALSEKINRLHLNHGVASISETQNGFEIDCVNGKQWIAEKIVVAIPFSVLRKLKLKVNLPPVQHDAINQLNYTKISKMVARVEKPFWEIDGLPPNMWCHSALERCFLSQSEQGNPLLTVFINGVGTQVLDAFNDAQASEWIIRELARTRPSTRNALKPLTYTSWGKNQLAAGAYHAFGPGQVSRFAHPMVKPAGGLFFAGEHCARASTGMEGALESGEITAQQVLEEPSAL